MKYIDLHMHSICSDGSYTPKELVRLAREKGLSDISLTDHDSIDGLKEAEAEARRLGIGFVPGIEMNCFYMIRERRVNLHMLGYGFQPEGLKEYVREVKALRDEHNDAIADALRSHGLAIDYEQIRKQAQDRTITRLNFAQMLVQQGDALSVEDALRRYLHRGGMAYVEYKFHSAPIVIQKLHEAGGIASLAHPVEYGLNEEDLEVLVASLAEHGLDAIECIHPSQNTAESEKIQKLAKQYKLQCSGGSDFHELGTDGIDLGTGGEGMRIPRIYLEHLFSKK